MPDRITIRMSPDLINRLDQWIAAQPGFVSRQEAMRRLVAAALDQQEFMDGCVGHAKDSAPGSGAKIRTQGVLEQDKKAPHDA